MILYILCFVTQSCPTLYNSMDYSPPGSSVHGDSPGKNTGIGSYSSRPCPPPGDLPDPGIEPGSPALQANSLPAELPRKLHIYIYVYICKLITKIRSDNTAITSHRYNYVVKTLKKYTCSDKFQIYSTVLWALFISFIRLFLWALQGLRDEVRAIHRQTLWYCPLVATSFITVVEIHWMSIGVATWMLILWIDCSPCLERAHGPEWRSHLPNWRCFNQNASEGAQEKVTQQRGGKPRGGWSRSLCQYSCLENPYGPRIIDWQATVHGVAKSRTQLSD